GMRSLRMVGIAGLAMVARDAGAQTRWQSILIDQSGPIARDIASDQLVMFGRVPSLPLPGPTWVGDGASWTAHVMSTTLPPGAVLAYTFGGVIAFSGSAADNRLWRWSSTFWAPVATFGRPPGRERHAMCFDQGRGCVVLFGGADASSVRNDTWEWD